MNSWLGKLSVQSLDFILPPRCPISGDVVTTQGDVSASLWEGLRFVSQPCCDCCGVPFSFDDTQFCTECLRRHPPFDHARSALVYDDASRAMILRFKHGDCTKLAPSFARWMVQAAGELLSQADVIVPVPLHRLRLLSRRYNQAALLSKEISSMTGVPSCLDGLVRSRATVSQGHLSAPERARNVRSAFDVKRRYQRSNFFKGKHVVLVDDVYTSGATLRECTKTLKRYESDRIDVLTLARVVYDA